VTYEVLKTMKVVTGNGEQYIHMQTSQRPQNVDSCPAVDVTKAACFFLSVLLEEEHEKTSQKNSPTTNHLKYLDVSR
jgi:hypothetical protein